MDGTDSRSEVEFCKATEDDVPALAALLRTGTCGYIDLLYEGLSVEERLRRQGKVSSYESFVVARLRGDTIGMATAFPIDVASLEGPDPAIPMERLRFLQPFRECSLPGSYYLQALAVRPEHRRQGIGTRLFDWIVERGAKAGCKDLSLHVFAANPATRLYQRLGMEVVTTCHAIPHEQLVYHGDLLLMSRGMPP